MFLIFTNVAEMCPHTNIQQQTRRGKVFCPTPTLPPTHPFPHPLPHTLQANWESHLADLPSYTERVIAVDSRAFAHYPQQGSALLEPKLPERTWLTSRQTLSPRCHGNHNLATATWQGPTPRGIDWVSNAVGGGLGRVLLSPSVHRDTQVWALPDTERMVDSPKTMMTALAWTQRWKMPLIYPLLINLLMCRGEAEAYSVYFLIAKSN